MKVSTSFTALGVKLVGLVMLISSLIDFIFLMIPPNLQNRSWQITVTNSLVDRGVVPLLGITLLILGWWMSDNASSSGKPIPAIRLPIFIVSSLLGLMFLLLVPLHLSNVSTASGEALSQIEQEFSQQEGQIQGFLEQLDSIAKDPKQLQQEISQRNEVIDAGGVIEGRRLNQQQVDNIISQRDQLQQLLDLSQKPEELQVRLEEARDRLQTQLSTLRREQTQGTQTEALKQTLRTGISSFLLAMAYIVLGWFGIQGMTGAGAKAKSS
ncbi:MAG: hypothetical protein IGQ45_03075 [Cyanobacterium sp. T60_A2020_053]|nr:hypothetical protein [Cyanobacterium sp. T60_A2020_053]